MKKNGRLLIRLICVVVLFLAIGIVFVRKGVIPRFWERSVAAVDSEAASEEPEQTGETTENTEKDTEDNAGDHTGNDTETETPAVTTGDAVDGAEETELTPEEVLAAYLSDDPRTPTAARGIYVTGPIAGTQNTMPELTSLVTDSSSLNAMVIDIKNDAGEITYKMELPLAQETGATVRYVADMPALIQSLKEQGIYLIARIVAFKDPILAEGKPEYAVKNQDGSVFYDNDGMAWVNPYREEVWDYLIDVSKEAVALGFDEIQYDYIRFSTAEGIGDADFGPEAEEMTKQDAINGFLAKAYETLAPMGVYLSADVFGTIICNESDGELIGQDYVEMAKHCDYICPMVYPSHYVNDVYGIEVPDAAPYDLIYAALADGADKLEQLRASDPDIHVALQRPWLQAFTASWVDGHISYGSEQLQDQVQGAADAGTDEWLLWNAVNNYDNFTNALK